MQREISNRCPKRNILQKMAHVRLWVSVGLRACGPRGPSLVSGQRRGRRTGARRGPPALALWKAGPPAAWGPAPPPPASRRPCASASRPSSPEEQGASISIDCIAGSKDSSQPLIKRMAAGLFANANLIGWPSVIHWSPSRDGLHDQHSEAINVAPLVQHPGFGILRRHIPASNILYYA
jgi:hypothetical protein